MSNPICEYLCMYLCVLEGLLSYFLWGTRGRCSELFKGVCTSPRGGLPESRGCFIRENVLQFPSYKARLGCSEAMGYRLDPSIWSDTTELEQVQDRRASVGFGVCWGRGAPKG